VNFSHISKFLGQVSKKQVKTTKLQQIFRKSRKFGFGKQASRTSKNYKTTVNFSRISKFLGQVSKKQVKTTKLQQLFCTSQKFGFGK
jgi:hypothetical protein